MNKHAILGVALAIAITTTMDATGYTMFSALPLLPLMLLFWHWQGFSRTEMGFVWDKPRNYLLAILYPIAVLGAVALIATVSGVVDLSEADWKTAGLNIVVGGLTTIIVVALTEEGFFRGWLWASLKHSGNTEIKTLIISSVAFALWHLSPVILPTGFDLPAAQIPVFMVNAVLMGAIWGMLRMASGSVIVASVSHGIWNGLVYPLFGFGEKVGALGIQNTAIFGPEVGVVGLTLNIVFAVLLWRWLKKKSI